MLLKGQIAEKLPVFDKEKTFRISAWVSPIPETLESSNYKGKKFISVKAYKDIKKCGLTHIYALYENGNLKETIDAINAANKVGIKYFVRDSGICVKDLDKKTLSNVESVKAYKDLPGYFGHLVQDEPSSTKFGYLGNLKKIYKQVFKDKEFYVNLNPTYASEEQIGVKTYEEYIDGFIEHIKPDFVSLDHYAMMVDDKTGIPYLTKDVLYNYEIVSDRCRKHNIGMMTFVANLRYNQFSRIPTEKEVRWQIYSQLAYGSVGIQYFCYWTPIEFVGEYFTDAMISLDGKKTKQYYYAKKMNRVLKNMENAFLSYKHQGTMLVNGKNSKHKNEAFKMCKNSVSCHSLLNKVEASEDAIIGCFSNEKNESSFLIMNYTDPIENKTCDIELKINSANKVMIYYNNKRHLRRIKNNLFNFKIPSGEGLFIIPIK